MYFQAQGAQFAADRAEECPTFRACPGSGRHLTDGHPGGKPGGLAVVSVRAPCLAAAELEAHLARIILNVPHQSFQCRARPEPLILCLVYCMCISCI